MGITLAAGGVRAPVIERDASGSLFGVWDAAVREVLERAVAWSRAKARMEKRREWCESHWDHPLLTERRGALRESVLAWNAETQRLVKSMDRVELVQGQLTETERAQIGILLGLEITPNLAGIFAARASELETTDLFRIACDVYQFRYDPDRWERRNDPCRVAEGGDV